MTAERTAGDGRICTLYFCGRCEEAKARFPLADYPIYGGELQEYWAAEE